MYGRWIANELCTKKRNQMWIVLLNCKAARFCTIAGFNKEGDANAEKKSRFSFDLNLRRSTGRKTSRIEKRDR